MRRLWIEWQESAVGSVKKMKVYIEDRENWDVMIGDVPCRKLGEVKHGQQKRFSVSEDEAKVFVTAGKVGAKSRCEFVRIPEGREDVFFTGSKRGKSFRFANAVTEETREPIREHMAVPVVEQPKNRGAAGSKLVFAVVILCIVAAAVVGGVIGTRMILGNPETIEYQQFRMEEFRITLTEEFEQKEVSGSTACYAAPDVAVSVLREDFSLQKGFEDLTVEEYGERILKKNSLSSRLRRENGLAVFDYVYADPETEDEFYCYTVLFKGSEAFWAIRFCAEAEAAQERLPDFQQWATSIRLGE